MAITLVKDFNSSMCKLLVVAIMILSFCYTCYGQQTPIISAEPEVSYWINNTNSKEDPTTHVYTSQLYQYDSLLGSPPMDFDNTQLFFEYEKADGNYFFKVNVISTEVDSIQKTVFGILELSVQSDRGVPDRAVFRFNAPNGIMNVDLLRHARATFIAPSSYSIELSPVGDKYGIIRRYCNMFEVEVNLKFVTESLGKSTFQLSIWTEDSPNDPTPLVDYRWLEVPYPASFMMKLESEPAFTRYFGVGFFGQSPVNYLQAAPPKFMLTEVNNVKIQDIKDDRLNTGTFTVMKSYSFQSDNLNTKGSFMQYNYAYTDLKDIYGNEVEIKFDEVYCGTSNGVAYQPGVPIYPVTASYESYGSVMCPESVMVPNSVVIIYAKVVMIKRPQVDVLTDSEKVSGEVSNGFGKLMRTGQIDQDTCVLFKGSVAKSKLSIYMLQQKLEPYNINPSPKQYTELQTLEIGSDLTAKFCSTKEKFDKVGAFQQEMAFLLLSSETSMVSDFKLVASVGEPSVAGTVVGILFAVGIVGLLIVASIIGGIMYWRRRKSAAYDSIN